MSTTGYTDEDLADLTEAERAALTDPDAGGDGSDGNENDNEQESGDAEGNADGAGAGNDDAGADGAEGAAAPVADAGAADADAGEQGAAPSAAAQPAPILVVEAPADAEEQLAEVASKKADLDTQFDDGDITTAEYRKQMDALNKQEREIEFAQREAALAAKMEQQRQQNEWNSQCQSFLDKHKEYLGDANAERFGKLNEMVIALANMPSNRGITGPELLAKAHKIVSLEYGDAAPVPAAEPKPKAAAKSVEKNVPPSLHAVPAAEPSDASGGKWAALDRLNPDQLEDALMKLSSSDRAAYLAAR